MKKVPSRWKLQPAPLLAPWWAPTVVVVNIQMPWVGLSWGRWMLVVPGRDYALEYTQTHTHTHTHDLPRFRALVRR